MTTIDYQFKITEEIFSKCDKFAKESVGTSTDKYARRNQFDPGKIMKDIRNGKIAEQISYEKISGIIPGLSEPDYNIYDKKHKSWDPDLKDKNSNIRVAVKSQDIESALHFGESWVFQFNDGKKYDCDTGIFGKDLNQDHYVSFVLLNVAKRIGSIRSIVKVQWLHDKKLFKAMQKQNLQGNKVAVYFDDLSKYKEELFQL
ncbi:hypothetical protein UFOVP1290_433 [uncultured Caudovirales phage]|uniref:Uncharacterized protein n=1 Tax=uncultured Caudovirales phage TaxID=2100421 RepID=A0A6J5RHP3_9CAUD|nr:hypothetical protein UFOVP1290_433 [uncultured Caudovirales phage]